MFINLSRVNHSCLGNSQEGLITLTGLVNITLPLMITELSDGLFAIKGRRRNCMRVGGISIRGCIIDYYKYYRRDGLFSKLNKT